MRKLFKEDEFIYKQVAEDLIKRIQKNEFTKGKLLTERKLADEYNINRITLRKAVDILVKEKHVFRLGTKGTFIGQRSNSITPKTIGYVLINVDAFDEHHSKIILEFEKALKSFNSNLMIFTINSENQIKDVLLKLIQRRRLDGILVTGLTTAKIVKRLKKLDIPTVLLGYLIYSDPVENEFDRVILDSVDYSYRAVQYLIRLGHKEIALINGPSYQWFLNIYQGYIKALSDSNIEYKEKLVQKCEEDVSEHGVIAMNKILKNNSPAAVFAANDRLAYGALNAIKDKGLKIPNDISVVGIGNYENSKHTRPPLTTIDTQPKKIANTALKLLFERIADKKKDVQTKLVHVKIIERYSCEKR